MLCRAPASRVDEQASGSPAQPPGFCEDASVQALLHPGNGRERHDERKPHQHRSGRNNAIRSETSGCPYPSSSRRVDRGDAAAPCRAERRRQCRAHRGDRDGRRAFRRPHGTAGAGRTVAGFPLILLMQQMANSSMGGGSASGIARARAAGRHADASALVVHGIIIAAAMAAISSAVLLLGGPAIYRLMGGSGETRAAALEYSIAIFAGALAYWLL